MRSALESDIVSENIHNWIDLIFGFKQTGKMAEESNNLFAPMTYEENVNIDTIPLNILQSKIDQIIEFGQTPRQLFIVNHPQKKIRSSILYKERILLNPNKDIIGKYFKYNKEKDYIESKLNKIIRSKEEEKEKIKSDFEKSTELYEKKLIEISE
jgi:hypothetical protein